MKQRIGIDLGGTKIEGVVLNSDNSTQQRLRVATPKDYDSILAQVISLINKLHTTAPDASIGIGCPGHINTNGDIANSNTQCLNGRRLHADIEQELGQTIRIENDANCFALAEALLGNGKHFDTVFGVILGTGVGGGVVVNNKLLSGKHHIAGEWGHNVLDNNGPECYCGKRGCVETFLSGPGLADDFNSRYQTQLDAKSIFQLADTGDQYASEYRDLYIDRLAHTLSLVINIIDPDCIVLGGGISNVDYLYSGRLHDAVRMQVFHPNWHGEIVKNQYGDSAGVIGAALLW